MTGDWMSRSDIAKAIGKKRLTPYDIQLLEQLVSEQRAEVMKREKRGYITFSWVYRAAGSK